MDRTLLRAECGDWIEPGGAHGGIEAEDQPYRHAGADGKRDGDQAQHEGQLEGVRQRETARQPNRDADGAARADVLALAVPHPARSTLAIMTKNVAATTEIRRLGACMRNSSGLLADLAGDETWMKPGGSTRFIGQDTIIDGTQLGVLVS